MPLITIGRLLANFSAAGRESQVKEKGCPQTVIAAFRSAYPNATIRGYAKEKEHVRTRLNALQDLRPWKIVVMHHPIYSSARKYGSSSRLPLLLEPLFVRYHVAIVFAGHDHVYERLAQQKGVLYLVSGAGGQLRQGDIDWQNPLFVAGNDRYPQFYLC